MKKVLLALSLILALSPPAMAIVTLDLNYSNVRGTGDYGTIWIDQNTSSSVNVYATYNTAYINKPTTGGNTVVHTCTVANVPIQKWVNLVLSVYGRTMDLYIDGKLVRTCLLPGIASVNSSADIYVTPAGGFDGWTSRLQYFPDPGRYCRYCHMSSRLLNGFLPAGCM